MKKKLFSLVSALLLLLSVLSLAGCGSSGAPASAGGKDATAEDPIIIKVSHVEAEDRSIHTSMVAFKEYVEAESGGRLQVEIYPNGQLGDDKAALEAIQLGTLHMTVCGAANLSSFGDQFGAMDLPFLFNDFGEMSAAVVDGPLGELYASYAEEFGFKILGFEYDGARSISNNVRPINTVADCKGLKIRVMENPVYISLMSSFGANPSPMSFSELYTAMAQNVVDGQDNPPSIGYANKFYEVQKYYSWTRHTFQNAPIVTSAAFFDSLPADLQTIVTEGAKKIETEQRAEEFANESNFEKLIGESENCTANEVTDREGFQEAARKVYDEYRKTVGDETMDAILEAAGKRDVY